MSSGRERKRPAALGALDAFNDKIAAEVPGYAEDLDRERKISARCQAVRGALRARRQTLKIGQTEMANRMGLTQSAISKIEGGYGDLGLHTVFRYLEALGEEEGAFLEIGGFSPPTSQQGMGLQRALISMVVARQVHGLLSKEPDPQAVGKTAVLELGKAKKTFLDAAADIDALAAKLESR